jgi:hypothetical protein
MYVGSCVGNTSAACRCNINILINILYVCIQRERETIICIYQGERLNYFVKK